MRSTFHLQGWRGFVLKHAFRDVENRTPDWKPNMKEKLENYISNKLGQI